MQLQYNTYVDTQVKTMTSDSRLLRNSTMIFCVYRHRRVENHAVHANKGPDSPSKNYSQIKFRFDFSPFLFIL